jgi:nicotinamide phosphoribosyltransferase
MTNFMGIDNPLLDADSYKASQGVQYPPGTDYVYSYIESRGGEYDKTVFFGLQMYLKKYMTFRITKEMVDEATEWWTEHGEPFNRKPWDRVWQELDGILPLEIRAVPEGTVIDGKNALVTIVNTIPGIDFAQMVSFFETQLLRAIWYPTTIATNSYRIKQMLKAAFEESSDDPAGIAFKLHDFGARGVSSKESAGIGGLAHLVNFMGTDTMTANLYGREYYHERMAGFSIPAAEHSTVTSWGPKGQVKALQNMIKQFGKKDSLFASPIDSYDTWDYLENVVGACINDIETCGGTFVARPDSGDPFTVPVRTVEFLGSLYGYTVNSKGYKVLPRYLRVIQGDGITIYTIPIIIKNLLEAGWSIDNLAFGQGGGLLQMVNRDTQ